MRLRERLAGPGPDQVGHLPVEVDADKPDSEPTITAARAVVHVESNESQEVLERTLDKVMRTCPVGALYEKANIEVSTVLIKE